MKYPRKTTLLITIGIALLSANLSAAKLYKWVDADGNISYQDTPPPANAKLLKQSTIEVTIPATEESSNTPVTVYTVENCEACDQLTAKLRVLEIPFSEQSLLNRDIQAEIISASESLTAPTLKIGSEYFSGLSDVELESELEIAGYRLTQAPTPEVTNPLSPPGSGEP